VEENGSEKQERVPNPTEKPWDHKILVDPGTGLTVRCTCDDYQRTYPEGTDFLRVANDNMHHLNTHPEPPVAAVQVGSGDFLLVMSVPGTSKSKKVHMTIAVPEAVFGDNAALARHLGPIGSKAHFELYEHQMGHHDLFSGLLDRMPGAEIHIARSIEELFDAFRNHGDPGVAMFEEQKEEEEQESSSS